MHAWHELVVRGSDAAVRAFVSGFVAGHGAPGDGLILAHDVGLAPESLAERVRELFHAGSHVVVLAPERLAVALADALAASGLAVEERRLVRRARVAFEVDVFDPARADDARAALFGDLPDGVTVVDPVERVERHPEAKGVELYAPLHAFTFHAAGTATGPLPGVLEMRRRAATVAGATVGALHLDATPLA
jgi:hypothetical protein